ncbi:MAG: hypothetical protein P4L50_01485 [Anaerolineaceae bacterium]|nr:hypothetical protein [Anaerolineaceae bacterium]
MERNISTFDGQLFGQLWSIFLSNKPVRLLNIFHGVPISYEATISMISQTYLGLSVHYYQAVCIALERYTYLQSERLTSCIRGRAAAVDIRAGEVIIGRLTATADDFGNRTNLRVQPKEPILIDIRNNGERHAASLADLSIQGIDQVTLGVLGEHDFNLRQNQEVDLSLKLPLTNGPIRFCGIAGYHSFDQKRNLQRMRIQLSPDSSSQSLLTDYISQRQTEIMQELERIYKSMRKPAL